MGKKKQKKTNLPALLYAYEYRDGGETYYVARPRLMDTIDSRGPRIVGTYRLAVLNTVRQNIEVEPIKL